MPNALRMLRRCGTREQVARPISPKPRRIGDYRPPPPQRRRRASRAARPGRHSERERAAGRRSPTRTVALDREVTPGQRRSPPACAPSRAPDCRPQQRRLDRTTRAAGPSRLGVENTVMPSVHAGPRGPRDATSTVRPARADAEGPQPEPSEMVGGSSRAGPRGVCNLIVVPLPSCWRCAGGRAGRGGAVIDFGARWRSSPERAVVSAASTRSTWRVAAPRSWSTTSAAR